MTDLAPYAGHPVTTPLLFPSKRGGGRVFLFDFVMMILYDYDNGTLEQ